MESALTVLDNKSGKHDGSGFMQSGCNPEGKCGNGLEKIYPACAVRYGYMRYLGEFRYSPGMKFNCGGKVVVQTSRGIELGEQVSLTCSGCEKSINRKQIVDYVKNSGPDFMQLKAGRILRVATPADLDEQTHLNMAAAHKLMFARNLARQLELPMKFVTCEHLLGGERVIFHFMSEDRIDFRELVRQLAQEYHTRIEMHQVGARDEARLVADYEICGRECCCKNFLKKLRQVNMKMAKLQKATLDPTKVSGRCGRLRCCLRYEHEGYEEMSRKLPKIGSRIRTEKGTATVKNRQILTQLLSIIYDGTNEWETVPVEEILERGLPRLERLPDERSPDEQRPARGGRGEQRRDHRPRPENRNAGPAAPAHRNGESDENLEDEDFLIEPDLDSEPDLQIDPNQAGDGRSGFSNGILDDNAVPSDFIGDRPNANRETQGRHPAGPIRPTENTERPGGAPNAGAREGDDRPRRRRRGRRRRNRTDGERGRPEHRPNEGGGSGPTGDNGPSGDQPPSV